MDFADDRVEGGIVNIMKTALMEIRTALIAVLVGVAFYFGAKLGLVLSTPPDHIATFWPPNTIILAALLLTDRRSWWIYFLAMAPAYFIPALQAGYTMQRSLIFFTANCAEIFVAAFALKSIFKDRFQLGHRREMFMFLLIAVLIAPVISAFIASTTTLAEPEVNYWLAWRVWFLGDALGHLMLTPVIILWISSGFGWVKEISLARLLEVLGLVLCIFAVGFFALGMQIGTSGSFPALLYTSLPVLLWAALRFGTQGICSTVFVITLLAIWNAINGRGPFTTNTPAENVLSLQLFLISISIPTTLLASILSERKQAEELLRKSEGQYRRLVESAQAAISTVDIETGIILDPNAWAEELAKSRQRNLLHVQRTPLAVIGWNANFEVTEWNLAAEKIFGYRKEEALGRNAEFIIHESAKESVADVWQDLLSQQGGTRSTNENLTKDGNTIFCEWYNTPLVSESGEVLGAASLAQDITERKHVEAKLKLLNETLEQRVAERTVELKEKNIVLNKEIAEREKVEEALLQSEKLKSIGTITAGISHEFNNILNIISGKVQLLEMDYNDNSELMGEFSTIMKAVDDGTAITGNMLKITKASDSTLAFVSSDLNELIKQSIEFTKPRWKSMAQANGIDYIIDQRGMENISPLLCNPIEIREVFINIINNAMDAMPDGGSISFCTWSKEDTLFVSISDTGKGMTKEVKSYMFDPFFTTRRPEGTGLGMSIAYGIIIRHGGKVEVESDLGRGSTFTLQFPTTDKKVSPTATLEQEQEINKKNLRILVVEDEEDLCDILDKFLSKRGCKIKIIDNGVGAINIINVEDFDLVLCDLAIPDVNGYEVVRAINKLKERPKIGITTGWKADHKLFDKEDMKVDFFLKKPFKLSELAKHINDAFGTES